MKTCLYGVMFLSLVALIGAAQESVDLTNANMSASLPCQVPNAAEGQMEEYLNPGETITLNSGCRFAVRMRSNPTTGYGWQLAKPLDEKIVMLVTNDFIRPESRLMGAGGHEVWIFKTVGQGAAEISLKYVRSWETNRPPAETNVFKVIVK
ncbi:MAG: protease inhibitor I42 family protein [Kiritimatiellaeota bacterium]|nr:protease inhibitor I42 family protein [Kiritimatiellota bacterium]